MGSGRRAVAFLLPAAIACACAPREPAPAGAARQAPLEGAAYERRLAESAGGPVSAAELLELAADAGVRIEARMDALAAALGGGGGWRQAFEPLLAEAPATAAELIERYRRELGAAAAFVAERDLVALPAAAPEVVVLENPTLRAHFPLALYHGGKFAVTTAAGRGEDPAYLSNHCRVCIPPLAVHEGYPGHHVAFARMEDAAGKPPTVLELARSKPFVEGWGLYAELLMLEQGYYREPAGELGAWRLLLLRVLRAEIDARLHAGAGSLTPAAAEEIYRRRLLISPAAAAAEVRIHLAKPTVKASYLVGLSQLLALRELALAADPELRLRAFHDRLLGPPSSVPRIARERFDLELGSRLAPVPVPPGATAGDSS